MTTDPTAQPDPARQPDPGDAPTPPPAPPAESFEPHLSEARPVTLAVVREIVGMEELPSFYDRAFRTVLATLQKQGSFPVGPPVGVYYGQPGETVDVAAGFPVGRTIVPEGDVRPAELPAGPVAEMIHQGSYDNLARSYQRLEDWMREEGHTAALIMWETYLTMPTPEGDPDDMLTRLTWPLVAPGTTPPPVSTPVDY